MYSVILFLLFDIKRDSQEQRETWKFSHLTNF